MSLLAILLCFNSLSHVHSSGEAISFVFNGFAGANLTVHDSATVTPDGVLVLTNGTYLMKGHGVYPTPLHFRSPPSAAATGGVVSFSTTFAFAILSEYADLSAYGLAFFVAPTSKSFSHTLPSQFMGLFNTSDVGNATNHVFAVELDTLLNVEFGDMNSNHVGIDINGLRSLKAASAAYYDDGSGVLRNLSLISGKTMQVWVDYDGPSRVLEVTLAPLRVPKPRKPLLSHAVDLSKVITDASYAGFAASQGVMSSRHCVLGWSFSLNGSAPPLDYDKLPKLTGGGGQSKSNKVLEAVLPVGVVAFVIAVATGAFVFGWRRVKYAELREEWEDEFGPHRFSYKDLFLATGGFVDRHLLGAGGFGRVYKGVLPGSNLEVAVKRVSHDSRQGIREFVAEITSIGRLQHRNLARLLGYCRRRGGELLLVYEYMPNGSLDKFLYDRERKPDLDWGKRLRIIRDVAQGLFYLHNNCEQVIVHRDVKASNVLLDGGMSGRLGDFGLARLHDHGADPRTTRVVGTIGYLAPELARTSKATPRTDVFAFGVFLLEITCGRRPIEVEDDARGGERVLLVDWVRGRWAEGRLGDCVDEGLRGEHDAGEASLALKLGLLCTQASPGARPSMVQVVQYLDGSLRLPEPPLSALDFGAVASLQSHGFDSYAYSMSYPTSSDVSHGTVSDLSGGR